MSARIRSSPPTAVPAEAIIETLREQRGNPLVAGCARWIATAGGAGLAPVAPGTAGSALAALLFPWLAGAGGTALGCAIALAFGLGVWAAGALEAASGRQDDGRIVIDEVVGQWLTLAPLAGFGLARSPLWLVTGFVAFRCLDIWKPGPIRWAERRFGGGLGVMLDDVIAGCLGAGLLGAVVAGLGLEVRR